MKHHRIIPLAGALLTGAVLFLSCRQEPLTGLAAVTDVTWTPVSGGAVISFKAPRSNDLLYVKAAYTNSLGNNVFKVCSIYDHQIEVEGLMDETRDYPVTLTAIDKRGAASPETVVLVKPDRSYINIVKDNLAVVPVIGGISITWTNPLGALTGGKTVHLTVTVTDADGSTDVRYISSAQREAVARIRGFKPGRHTFSFLIEDTVGNQVEGAVFPDVEVEEEKEFEKFYPNADGTKSYLWSLVPELTTLFEVWENRNAAIFDGVIDYYEVADDNSYAGTDANGGTNQTTGQSSPLTTMPWDTDQLDIVVNMNRTVSLSRFKVWQRGFEYASRTDENQLISAEPYYYKQSNLKSFKLFGSMDAIEWFLVADCDIESNSTAGPLPVRDGEGNPDAASLQVARDGHEWELTTMSPPMRYFRVRFTSNWDRSIRECSGMSEITLYGADVVQ